MCISKMQVCIISFAFCDSVYACVCVSDRVKDESVYLFQRMICMCFLTQMCIGDKNVSA